MTPVHYKNMLPVKLIKVEEGGNRPVHVNKPNV